MNDRRLAVTLFWLVIWVRSALAFRLMFSGQLAASLFGGCDLAVVLITLRAVEIGEADWTFRGSLVGFLYLAPLCFVPTGGASVLQEVAFIAGALLQTALRLRLGVSVTVACPVFVRVEAAWPYSVIRHPLSLFEVGVMALMWSCWPTVWNAVVFALCVACGMGSVLLEEAHLVEYPAYVRYAQWVRWRWIPEVW